MDTASVTAGIATTIATAASWSGRRRRALPSVMKITGSVPVHRGCGFLADCVRSVGVLVGSETIATIVAVALACICRAPF